MFGGVWVWDPARTTAAHMETRPTSISDNLFLPFMEPPQDVQRTLLRSGLRPGEPLLLHLFDRLLDDIGNDCLSVLGVLGRAQARPDERVAWHIEDERFERHEALLARISRLVHGRPRVAVIPPERLVVAGRPCGRLVGAAPVVV